MKKENWIYLLAFLCGVVLGNVLGTEDGVNGGLLNRYSLATLSFQMIEHEEYLIQVLVLRFRTVAGLWILSRIIPAKMVVVGFAGVISMMLGMIMAFSILTNGIWGSFFFLCALLPHGIFYGMAYFLWENASGGSSYGNYGGAGGRREKILATALILMVTAIGCICEAYISPIVMENVIKF